MASPLVPIFFLSGVAGLTFETLWFRLAGLSLGNSVWSASLVLAAFMAGLTLGNGLVARLHSRIAEPIRLYALLELTIGVGSFLVVLALPRLSGALGPLFATVTDTPWLLNAVRLGSAFTLLAIPTTAMGATLPLLTDALSRSNSSFGAALGKLYGWNTLGAMLGAIATEAAFVRFFGILNTGLIAMLLNLAAGTFAFRLATGTSPAPAKADNAKRTPLTPRAYRYLLVALLSGAVMLALEVVWFRFLLLTYTGTGLAFALMLAIVLAGIGLGGLAAGRLARGMETCHRWLPHVTAASGLLVAGTYYGFDMFTATLSRDNPTLPAFVGFAVFLMLPVSLASGAAFTLIAQAVKQELGGSMRTTGIVALWNTVGATAGSLASGFVLLPTLGMERSLFVLAAIYCGTALLVPARAPGTGTSTTRTAWLAIAISVTALVLFPFGLMERSFFKIVERSLPEEKLIATREGLMETMRYYRRDAFGAPWFYRLVTNGFSMSGTTILGKRYMKLYVYLPLALQPDTHDALLISYGVGSTAKALTDSSGLRRIDVVDISRDVLDMSSVVYADRDNPLHDPRVRVHVEDGRFFLSTQSRKYDLITSEPPPPKVAGVVNLYSREYFQSIHDHLTPHGRTTYWLPVHQLRPLDTLAIIKAFCGVFEDCTLWDGGGLEWMLMGGTGAGDERATLDGFTAQWRDDRVRRELIATGFEQPEQMGALFMGDASYLADLTGKIPPVTDNYPLRISSELVRDPGPVPVYATVMDERERLARFQRSDFIGRVWPEGLAARTLPYFRYEGLIGEHFTQGLYPAADQPFLWESIDDVLVNSRLETLPLWLLGSDRDAQRNALAAAQRGATAETAQELALGQLAQRDYAGALHTFEGSMAAAGGKISVGSGCLLLYLLGKNGRIDEARAVIAGVDQAKAPELGRCVDWFEAKFDRQASVSLARSSH
jgi:predicted membrane-bound spermidine synthase